jgi:hypothetical protein
VSLITNGHNDQARRNVATLNLVTSSPDEIQPFTSCLDEIARQGAHQMLVKALEEEVAEYLEQHKEHRDERGRAAGNG